MTARKLTLGRILSRLAKLLEPRGKTLEPEEMLSPEEQARQAIEMHRQAQRAGRRPWYYSRPEEVKIPENLRYFEAVHGTRATVEMIKKRAKKLDD